MGSIGRILALTLPPFEFVFWISFELPFGPLFGALRTLLVIVGWIADGRERGQVPRSAVVPDGGPQS